MIKTEFHASDFYKGDRVVLVNDALRNGDYDRRLIPGVEGKVIETYTNSTNVFGLTERVAVKWDLPNPCHLDCWWVDASDIQPAESFVSLDISELL